MHPNRPDDDRRVTYFAATHTRGKRDMFGIRAHDRGKHVYVIGKTGMGKSTMLENMAIQDIQNGEGIAFIDPHGSTAEKLLDFVPHDRINDVVYFAPFDTEYPIGFNVMEDVGYDRRHLVVSGLMGALKRIWVDAWSARMEYILQNTLLALLEYPESTLLDVNRMLTNKVFRAAVVEKISDPIVRSFWTEEFASFTDTYAREATPAIQNKVGQFTSNPLIRNIVGQPVSSFDLRKMMDEKKIFIVNLSKGRMGETNASLLGSMLVVKIYLAAISRADESAARMQKLPRFYFYVDEFQSMMNEAFADILSESRKYKLALTLANQYIEQMEEKVRDAVFGNVGTLVCFRVGPFDAEVLKTVFEPTFTAEDMVSLGIGQIYLTLMIDGVGSRPFSAETIPPIDPPEVTFRDDVVSASRDKYGRRRADMEALIIQKQSDFAPPAKMDRSGKGRDARGRGGPPSGRGGDDRRIAPRGGAPERGSPPDRPRFPNSSDRRTGPPARIITPEGQRGALRAALAAASPAAVPAPAPAPARSPADILRERMARKESRPPAPHATPQAVHGDEPKRSPERKITPPISGGDTPAKQRSNEVTTEMLRRLLKEEA
ncbi:MAG: type IV secretion system DNA-binding domain-containing protein [bacterium]|nr:type IV secretion system DNA-binding domain-containing protein [bacterium]